MDADIKAQIEFIDGLNMWNDVGPEYYECICSELGLDFDSYEDPDSMWDDVMKTEGRFWMKGFREGHGHRLTDSAAAMGYFKANEAQGG